MAAVLQWLKDNPVKVRSAITAIVVFVGWFVPGVTGVEEAVVGGVMSVLALFLGWDASKRVALPRDVETEREDAEADEAYSYFREMNAPEGKHRK